MIWLCFCSAPLFSLMPFTATREFLSFFNRYFRFTNLSTWSISPCRQAWLVLHLGQFQQLKHLYYWHHHHHHHHDLCVSSSLSEATSFRSPHFFLRYSATKSWTMKVAIDSKFQLYILVMVKKRLCYGWLKNEER